MCKNRLMYLTSLAGVLIFHTYYTGWFSWYLLMLTVTLPWFSLLCSLAPMLRLRISADMPAACLMGQRTYPAGKCRRAAFIAALPAAERGV